MNGKKDMTKLTCDTIQQQIVYQWIQKNFQGDNIRLALIDSCTLLLTDGEDHAFISFHDDMISIEYSYRYDYVIEDFPFKKPYL